jgi:hypothetical protein
MPTCANGDRGDATVEDLVFAKSIAHLIELKLATPPVPLRLE